MTSQHLFFISFSRHAYSNLVSLPRGESVVLRDHSIFPPGYALHSVIACWINTPHQRIDYCRDSVFSTTRALSRPEGKTDTSG